MRTLILALTLSALTACANEQTGPSSIGEPMGSSAKIANPGDEAVEFGSWYLAEGTTSNITFAMLVPECDSIGSCRWISDVYGYTQHDIRTPPVRTVIQNTLEICWLTDQDGEVIYGTNSLPDGNGNITFGIVRDPESVTLVCNINEDAEAVTIGTNISQIDNHKYIIGDGFEWYGTYNAHNAWSEPTQRVTVND